MSKFFGVLKKVAIIFCVCFFAIIIVSTIISLINEDEVFGKVQIYEMKTGHRASVQANKELMTDELLIKFWEENIEGIGFNWFNVYFEDGTSYLFHLSFPGFKHVIPDEDGNISIAENELGIGFISTETREIDFTKAIIVPDFVSFNEAESWAEENGINEVVYTDIYNIPVEKPNKIVGHHSIVYDVLYIYVE